MACQGRKRPASADVCTPSAPLHVAGARRTLAGSPWPESGAQETCIRRRMHSVRTTAVRQSGGLALSPPGRAPAWTAARARRKKGPAAGQHKCLRHKTFA